MAKVYLRQKGPGRWQLRVYLGTDGKGNPRYRHETVRGDRAAAEARRSELEAMSHRGAFSHLTSDTLGGWIGAYIDRREARGELQPSSVRTYRFALGWLPNDVARMPLANIRARHLESAYTEVEATKSAGSAKMLHRIVHVALEDAVRLEELPANPARYARPARRVAAQGSLSFDDDPDEVDGPKVYTEAEVSAILGAWDNGIPGVGANPFMAAATRLAYATGMRRGELLGLSWRLVDLDKGLIRVRRSLYWQDGRPILKEPKTSSSKRDISIGPGAVADLRNWRTQLAAHCLRVGRPMSSPVFPDWTTLEPMRPDKLSNSHARACCALGLDVTAFHALRHTHASEMLANRVPIPDVAERLGHSSPVMTLSVYAHAVPRGEG